MVCMYNYNDYMSYTYFVSNRKLYTEDKTSGKLLLIVEITDMNVFHWCHLNRINTPIYLNLVMVVKMNTIIKR